MVDACYKIKNISYNIGNIDIVEDGKVIHIKSRILPPADYINSFEFELIVKHNKKTYIKTFNCVREHSNSFCDPNNHDEFSDNTLNIEIEIENMTDSNNILKYSINKLKYFNEYIYMNLLTLYHRIF